MRVLGVDPAASGPTGYGIVESDGRQCHTLHYGALKVGARRQKDLAGAVLQDVHALLCRLIEEFSPDAMAIESVFTALNMRTALRLAEVRGVVLLAAAQHGLEVHSYAPREVKANIAGHGWVAYPAGTAFEVPGKSGFDVEAVGGPAAYLCEFL